MNRRLQARAALAVRVRALARGRCARAGTELPDLTRGVRGARRPPRPAVRRRWPTWPSRRSMRGAGRGPPGRRAGGGRAAAVRRAGGAARASRALHASRQRSRPRPDRPPPGRGRLVVRSAARRSLPAPTLDEASGGAPPAAAEPAQYLDFVRLAIGAARLRRGARLRMYWNETLSGELPVLDLPTDRPRPAVVSLRGSSVGFALDGELTASLKRLAAAEGTTPFVVMLAALQALLSRYTGQTDVLVGSPWRVVAALPSSRIVGNCMNTGRRCAATCPTTPPFRCSWDRCAGACSARSRIRTIPSRWSSRSSRRTATSAACGLPGDLQLPASADRERRGRAHRAGWGAPRSRSAGCVCRAIRCPSRRDSSTSRWR